MYRRPLSAELRVEAGGGLFCYAFLRRQSVAIQFVANGFGLTAQRRELLQVVLRALESFGAVVSFSQWETLVVYFTREER